MERRLAAILAADVVGYTRLMGIDESGTLRRVKVLFSSIVQPAIEVRGGRIVKQMGDGILAEFPSVVEAVQCSVDVQTIVRGHDQSVPPDQILQLRIGVNIGDIIFEDEDIFGDGVNVASRLETLAEPGGICVSRSVRDQIRDKLDLSLEDLGEINIKNVARPVRVFRLLIERNVVGNRSHRKYNIRIIISLFVFILAILLIVGASISWYLTPGTVFEGASIAKMAIALPNRPSVAVLPFRNLSGEETQRYFADGITEDIIADLAKVSGILVVAHGSTRGYRDKDVSFRKVAEELGVHHVLTGSIRRSGERLRTTVQLADAIKGELVWSEKYDRTINDLFAVQSDIAQHVVRAMSVTLKANEHDRLFQKYVANIDAYDAFLRARAMVDAPTRQNIAKGEKLFLRAIKLDPKSRI